jgi:ATP-binding cassette subfamily F protein uup
LVQKALQDSNAFDTKTNEATRLAGAANTASSSLLNASQAAESTSTSGNKAQSTSRMASWEARELDELPAKIQALESEQAEWVEKLASPELYQTQDGALDTVQAKIEIVENELKKQYARWEALEAKR